MEASHLDPRNSVRILLVEDEVIVRKDLEMILTGQGHQVVGSCSTATEAVALCEEHRPSLILMDVRLRNGSSGIDAARTIHDEYGTPVIFITGSSDPLTLSRARLTLPYGFLTKPYKAADVLVAVDLAMYNHDQHLRLVYQRDQLRNVLNGRISNDSLFIKQREREEGIRLQDIHYVEALKDYVGIHVGHKRYVVHATMNAMEQKLPSSTFLRVHRSFIVHMDHVQAIQGSDLIMEKQDQTIPIGIRYSAQVKQKLAVQNSLG